MLNPDQAELLEFVQMNAEALPVSKRIKVYRGLADCIESQAHREILVRMASILEEADHRCREFRFNFNAGGSK